MKKKIFIMICVLASVAITIIASFHYYSAQKEKQYATTAVPYLLRVIPELSKWDPAVAQKYMSATFMQKTSAAKLASALKALSRVGELQDLGKPHFEEVFSDKDRLVVSYTVAARYSTGDAEITIAILDLNDAFSVYRFNIRSKALAR
ncbi:hypothetical protein [Geopsychrobacter electrodiphilus]|uniref:hypothetical protein n=1 Tax=Geopsychrobacter electrodiphilus TaxID=225196 RepID=UPI000376884C|nr:hypothetical protein [Geopsychrobacter electrodiphilus]